MKPRVVGSRWVVLLFAIIALEMPDLAAARVTTSKVLCSCSTSSDLEQTKRELDRMISESRSVGTVIGVVITNVSHDVYDAAVREKLVKSSANLFSIIEELGIRGVERSVEFVESSPADYGCKGASLAVNVEFIYTHR